MLFLLSSRSKSVTNFFCIVDQGPTVIGTTIVGPAFELGELRLLHICSDQYRTNTFHQTGQPAAVRDSMIRVLSAIDRSFMRRFTQADVHELARPLIDSLLKKVEGAGTPEKVAENDYLMKCTCSPLITDLNSPSDVFARRLGVMRIIITARSSLADEFGHILARLVNILGVISKKTPVTQTLINTSLRAYQH